MTGASGGGYNTWITSALDDRIKVAVPVVGTSDFYEQIAVTRPLDWYHASEHCHFVPGLIRYANNHEFAAMVAPRPLMIIAASQDQSFPIEGVRAVYRYSRDLYGSFGSRGQTRLFRGHFRRPWISAEETRSRLRLVSAMAHGPRRRHALPGACNGNRAIRLRPICGALRKMSPLVRESSAPSGGWPRKRSRRSHSHCDLPPRPPIPLLRSLRLQRVLIPSGQIMLPAFYLAAPRETGVLVAVDDRGKEELAADPVIREAAARGWSICGVDPRGIGESATTQKGWLAATSLLLNEDFVLQQAEDIARVIVGFPTSVWPSTHAVTTPPGGRVRDRTSRRIWPGTSCAMASSVSGNSWTARNRSTLRSSSNARIRTATLRTTARSRSLMCRLIGCCGRTFRKCSPPARAQCLIVNPVDGDWRRMPAEAAQRLVRCPVVSSDGYEDRVRSFLNSF